MTGGPGTEPLRAGTAASGAAAAGAACSGSIMVRMGDPPDLSLARIHEQIVQRGARVLMQPKEEVYGERQFAVEDLEGNHWTFSETIKDVAPEEWGARVAK